MKQEDYESAQCIAQCYFLAKYLALVRLQVEDIVKSPAGWLRAQLDGYDSYTAGASQ